MSESDCEIFLIEYCVSGYQYRFQVVQLMYIQCKSTRGRNFAEKRTFQAISQQYFYMTPLMVKYTQIVPSYMDICSLEYSNNDDHRAAHLPRENCLLWKVPSTLSNKIPLSIPTYSSSPHSNEYLILRKPVHVGQLPPPRNISTIITSSCTDYRLSFLFGLSMARPN